jgi:hypothetical protein
MSSALPPVLENIVGGYSNAKEYKSLMQINKNIHTKEKFIGNELSNLDLKDIIKFKDAYNLMLEYSTEKKQPFDLNNISIFLKLVEYIPEIDIEFSSIFDLEGDNSVSSKIKNKSFDLLNLDLYSYNTKITELFFDNFTDDQKNYLRSQIFLPNHNPSDEDIYNELVYRINFFRSELYKEFPEIRFDYISENIELYNKQFIQDYFLDTMIIDMIPKKIIKQIKKNPQGDDLFDVVSTSIDHVQTKNPEVKRYDDINKIFKLAYPYILEYANGRSLLEITKM